jgi:GNAT superfamily N-acetyltransferase
LNRPVTSPPQTPEPEPGPNHTLGALLRHFADLRDGSHGDATSRGGKERLFAAAAELLDPYARQALAEVNETLLLGTGDIAAEAVTRGRDGGMAATWVLSWPEQRSLDVGPITLRAHYGAGFHHPHLRGLTVGEWPLNVFTEDQAAAELPTLRAIVAADLHNLVFQRSYHLVPAIIHRTISE